MNGKRLRCFPFIAACFALALTGCGDGQGSGDPSIEADGKITPMEIFNSEEKQLVYLADNIGKDAPAQLYVFQGGKIVYRSNCMIPMRDICDLSDDEIISLYQEREEEFVKSFPASDEDHVFRFDTEPTLKNVELSTDSSGNEVIREKAFFGDFEYSILSSYDGGFVKAQEYGWNDEWWMRFDTYTKKTSQVFDAYFGGYQFDGYGERESYLLLKVDNPDVEFNLDEVGTEGTTRD